MQDIGLTFLTEMKNSRTFEKALRAACAGAPGEAQAILAKLAKQEPTHAAPAAKQ